jgi:hypothetical protein
MVQTIFYLLLTLGVIYLLGYGLTQLVLPKKLLPYSLWITPWIAIITIINFLIIFSLLGIPSNISTPVLTILLGGISLYVFFKVKPRLEITFSDMVLFGIVLLSIIFNIIPILRREGILTTLSLGNNDIIAYVTVGDYLIHHSILESFYSNVLLPIANLLHDGYRWGPSILLSYFLTLFRLSGYQLGYIMQTILFGLTIPLIYVITRILSKASFLTMILVALMTALNANLLYMLYHNFFGQVLFWGIEGMLFILFFSYFGTDEEKNKDINRFDILIGLTIATLYTSYHEPAVFMFAPLVLYLIIRFLMQKNPYAYFRKLFIIAGIALGFSFVSILNAIIFDFGQTFAAKKGQPIGWELFRKDIPFANPFEALGFYSIHSFPPMPMVIAVLLSLVTISVIIWGILKSKQRLMIVCYFIVFIFFLYWSGIYNHHFFDYNRVVTYTLPFFIVLFVIGFSELVVVPKVKIILLLVLVGLLMVSGIKLNKKFRTNYISVDKSLASLRDVPLSTIREPIYVEGFIDSKISYWVQNWTGYFIYNHSLQHFPVKFNENSSLHKVPENALVLSGKVSRWYYPPKIILNNIIWENEYYKIGRLCRTDKCIQSIPADVSSLVFGKNDWEDTLLVEGWSQKEGEERYSNSLHPTLRLVKKSPVSSIIIETKSLEEPQQMSVVVNGLPVGETIVSKEWTEYSFPILNAEDGVFHIEFIFTALYDRGDTKVSAVFKQIVVK